MHDKYANKISAAVFAGAGSPAGSIESSAVGHRDQGMFLFQRQTAQECEECGGSGCQIHPWALWIISHVADQERKRGDKRFLRQDRKCPLTNYILWLILVGSSLGFVKMFAVLAHCKPSRSRITVLQALQASRSGADGSLLPYRRDLLAFHLKLPLQLVAYLLPCLFASHSG